MFKPGDKVIYTEPYSQFLGVEMVVRSFHPGYPNQDVCSVDFSFEGTNWKEYWIYTKHIKSTLSRFKLKRKRA